MLYRIFHFFSEQISYWLSLVLALEQILLLIYNPEFNVLKVAGSPAGLKRTQESMLPSLLKTSKVPYVYDNKAKKLIYSSKSLTKLAQLLNLYILNLSKLITNNSLYLNCIIFSNELLSESDYITEIFSPDKLIKNIDELRQEWNTKKSMENIRVAGSNKSALLLCTKRVEITNTCFSVGY